MTAKDWARSVGVAVLLATFCAPLQARAGTVVLLTGEWPPYTGSREPQGGSMAAIVRAAYAVQGDSVRLGFFSWFRIARLQQDNSGYAASFPHYYSEERARRCHFSRPIGSSPLGVLTRTGQRVQWKTLADLRRYRVGTGKSYVNVPEFDRLVAERKMVTVPALDDADNIRNLLAGKVDVVIIDRNVLAYLQNTAAFRNSAPLLQMDPRVLAVHNLYLCFPKHEKGRVARDRFDRSLLSLQAPLAP